jgi:predicted double-glycine peptidase
MIGELLATVIFGVIFWLGGQRLGRSMVQRGATANDIFAGREWLVIVVLLLYLGLVGLAVNLPQWQGLPLAWRLSGVQVSWTIIRVLLLGACGVGYAICWKTARNQILYLVLIAIIGLGCFTAVEGYFLMPIASQLRNDLRLNFIYRQSGDSSCAPAALATLMQRWNRVDVTESIAAKQAGTTRMGTSMAQIAQAIQRLNMAGVELSPTWEQLRQINRPGILAVWQKTASGRRLAHAVALMAMTREKAIIADPAQGKYLSLSMADFNDIWRREYLPVYRPGDDRMTTTNAAAQLKKLGYRGDGYAANLRSFQADMAIKPTGRLDPMTVLLLTGKPLPADQPSLDETQFLTQLTQKMGCTDRPQDCPWSGK